MNAWQGKRSIAIVTACMTAQGTPDFAINSVEVTHEEYEEGFHYTLAEDLLADAGFEEPFIHFDQFESPPFLHSAVAEVSHAAQPV
jgi:hypothetical protein